MTTAPAFDVRLSCFYSFAPGNSGVARVAARRIEDRTKVLRWEDQAGMTAAYQALREEAGDPF